MIWRIVTIFIFSCRLVFGLTFAWISDSHLEIGREGIADSERRYSLSCQLLRSAIANINRDAEIEFVVITGDLINDGRSYNLDALTLELADLKKPYFIVIGNNDFASPGTGFGISKQVFFSAFPKCFTIAGRGYWSKSWQNFLLIGIDAIHPKKEGNYFTTEFLTWFKNVLNNNRNKKIILFSHYPPLKLAQLFLQNNVNWNDRQSTFLALLQKANNVVGCFSGHIHQPIFKKIGDINFFVASALVQYPHVFYKVTVGEHSIKITSKAVASKVIVSESRALLQKYFQSHQLQKALFDLNAKQQLEGIHYY